MECGPEDNVDVVKPALALLNGELASVLPPSLKVTLPEGEPEPDAVTIAVNVTGWPAVDGFRELTTAVDVAVGAALTTWLSTADVLGEKTRSPPYPAVIECEPSESVEVVRLTLFPFRAKLVSSVVPSQNVIKPVGVPGPLVFTVAVKVTGWPGVEGFAELTRETVVAAFEL
jgi:hypothetical protein